MRLLLLLLVCLIYTLTAQRSTTLKPKIDPRVDPCAVCKTIAEHSRKIHMDEDDDMVLHRTVEVAKYVADFNQYLWKIIMQQYWDTIYRKINAGQSPEEVCTLLNVCNRNPI